jgi:hypothetical protein
MKRCFVMRLFFLTLLLFLAHLTGCSNSSSIYKIGKVMPGETSGLKKKVMVLSVIDQAGIGEEKSEQITASLVELLKKDKHLIVHRSTTPIPSPSNISSPHYGMTMDPELAQRSETMGMQAVITGILTPFEFDSQKTGIWPFRRVRRTVEISLIVNVFDVTTNTLLFTELKSARIKTKGDVSEGQEEKRAINKKKVDQVLSPILDDQASAIKKVLKNQPWTGRLISADGKKIQINGGKDVGIKAGSVFEVFGEGESITSAGGRTIYLSGPKLGDIKADEVTENYATVVPVADERFKAGQVIRLRH